MTLVRIQTEFRRMHELFDEIQECEEDIKYLNRRPMLKAFKNAEIARVEAKKATLIEELKSIVKNFTKVPHSIWKICSE